MVSHDFASILFRDILRFTQYPGAPFTGDVLADMVNYFLFPTVFIIIFLYILLGVITNNRKFRLLIGVTLYLVIIVNGWYGTFALFGQFYIILLIVLGIIYFVLAHFGIRIGGGGGGGGGAPTREEVAEEYAGKAAKAERQRFKLVKTRRDKIEDQIEAKEAALAAAIKGGHTDRAERLREEIQELEERLSKTVV